VGRYPFLTCEIGGGMMNSYHRRILFDPADNEATTLIKIGSGSTSPGYYMYHGGENPDGRLTTLQETQDTGYWNDMPVKNYDFQAPLGQYGQIRPQYHWLRRLHLFLHEWGPSLADMPALLPDKRPTNRTDFQTLRWSARSDGNSGFIFVNNYQRLADLSSKPDTAFSLNLPADPIVFPETPVTIPAGARFFWPFNFDLGHGVKLDWATAQPITAIDDGDTRTVFFAEIPDVPAQFAFPKNSGAKTFSGELEKGHDCVVAKNIKPGADAALQIPAADGAAVRIVLLSDADSCALWKGHWRGKDRAFLTRAGLAIDRDVLRLTSTDRTQLIVGVYPPLDLGSDDNKKMTARDGIFERLTPGAPAAESPVAQLEKIQSAGPLREIHPGKIRQAVASEPDDADFNAAAVWRIKLPANLNLDDNPLLRVHYTGDVARVTLNGKLLTDDFYNGNALDVGLRRYAPEILNGDLRVAILPLQKNAPIYMASAARPDFGTNTSVVSLTSAELVPRYRAEIK
jgi:beta-galactosidase